MGEQEHYAQASLTRSIWLISNQIAETQQQLAVMVAEKDRLVRHLEQLQQETERHD